MRLSKYENRVLRAQKRRADMQGSGRFIFENNTRGDLMLPRATKTGISKVCVRDPRVPGSGQFTGDDYYMSMVRTNDLRLIRQIEAPNQEPVMTEQPVTEDKLITEQPPLVTNEGTVEFVEQKPKQQKLNEIQPAAPEPEKLINEDPMDGVEVI